MTSASNPFAAAFENDPEAAPDATGPSPYGLGSVYGEDSMSLLDNEFTPTMASSSRSGLAASREGDGGGEAEAGGAQDPLPRGPARSKSTAGRCLDMVLCYAEWKVFRKIDLEVEAPEAAWATKVAFLMHWLSVATLLLNFVVLCALQASPTHHNANSVWALLLSFAYLVLGSFLGWYFLPKALFKNVRAGASPAWRCFAVSMVAFVSASAFLAVGFPGSGAAGAMLAVELSTWAPLPQFALIASCVCATLQAVLVGFALHLWRLVARL